MVTMRQLKIALCFYGAIQFFLGMWFASAIEHRCLFLFPDFSVKHAVLLVSFINLMAIFAMDFRRYYPTTIMMIVSGIIMLGLLVLSIVVAFNTTNFAWRKDRDCLIARDVCLDLESDKYQNVTLSTIVAGCCVPPTVCGYSMYNPLMFGNATHLDANPDCRTWKADQDKLCYNCNSCEIGVLKIVKKIWLTVLIISVFLQISVTVALGLVLQIKAVEDERVREVELQP